MIINDNEQLESTMFPVETEKIGDSFLAIKNAEEDSIISIMSNQYKLIPNKDVWNAMNAGLDGYKPRLKEVKMFRNARTQWTLLFEKNHNREIVVGDKINSGIRVYNSYDGSKKLTITAFFQRLVCSNGMVISKSTSEWNAIHMVDTIDMKIFSHKLKEVATKANNYIDNKIAKLHTIPTTEEKILEFIELFPKKLHEEVILALGNADNFYDVLNAGTYLMSHVVDREIESNIKLEERIVDKVVSMAGVA